MCDYIKEKLGIVLKGGAAMTEKELEQIKTDPSARNAFLEKYQPFVLKTASTLCKRHIDKSCEEYAVAFSALNEAIDRYTMKSNFLPFAALVIKTRLIDSFRTKNAPVDLIDGDDMVQAKKIDGLSMGRYLERIENEYRAIEIAELTKELLLWDISIKDLIKASPKHKRKRQYITSVIKIIESDADILEILNTKKQLSLDLLEKKYNLPRKNIEPFRKYIIAGVIIRIGDYNYLQEYIR